MYGQIYCKPGPLSVSNNKSHASVLESLVCTVGHGRATWTQFDTPGHSRKAPLSQHNREAWERLRLGKPRTLTSILAAAATLSSRRFNQAVRISPL